MFLKCICGFHDWEILERVNSKEQLRENLKVKYGTMIKLPSCRYNGMDSNLVRKVCLRCEKYVDRITPMIAEIQVENMLARWRKERAELIQNELKKVREIRDEKNYS